MVTNGLGTELTGAMFPGSAGGSVRRACSARAVDTGGTAMDGGGRSYSLAPPVATERCPLRRQHSAGPAPSTTAQNAEDKTGGYGSVKKERPDPIALEVPGQKCSQSGEGSPGGNPAVIISGRYLAVTGGAAWERRTSTPTYSSSDMGGDNQPPTPGSPSPSGRFRFRYNRSFTFRRSISSTSAGNGSRRGSTSPDKGRRAVQVGGAACV